MTISSLTKHTTVCTQLHVVVNLGNPWLFETCSHGGQSLDLADLYATAIAAPAMWMVQLVLMTCSHHSQAHVFELAAPAAHMHRGSHTSACPYAILDIRHLQKLQTAFSTDHVRQSAPQAYQASTRDGPMPPFFPGIDQKMTGLLVAWIPYLWKRGPC